MNHNDLYYMKNFDFLARSFARMYIQGQVVDIQAVIGNMDREHQVWFCRQYERYCRQVEKAPALETELEH